MMIQGTFMARFVAGGFRHWYLPIVGWLCAALAHAIFDWGMLKPLAEFVAHQSPQMMEAGIVQALPLILACIAAVVILGLWLLRRMLKSLGDEKATQLAAEFGADAEPTIAYRRQIGRWTRAGNTVLILGALGLVASIGGAVYLAATGALQPPANATPDLQDIQGSMIMLVTIAASPAAIILGLLLRWKR